MTRFTTSFCPDKQIEFGRTSLFPSLSCASRFNRGYLENRMNTNLSSTVPSAIETECLVVVVLDRGEKDKPSPAVETGDDAVAEASKDVIASGEVTGKSFETTLLHRPVGLKAKRLLLVGGGKAKTFSASDLRKTRRRCGAHPQRQRDLKSFAFVAPDERDFSCRCRAKVIVEGAFVGNFDPDYYKSDRKDAEDR